jgi:hypothetical protein
MPWTTEFHANGADVKYFGAITGADVLEAKAKFFADPQSMTMRLQRGREVRHHHR